MKPEDQTGKRVAAILASVFFFSGFAALLYQVAWQRILTVHFGVGTISITLIVSVYMFGLGLGSLFGAVISERIARRIRFYYFLELGIGAFGLASLPFIDYLGNRLAGSGYFVSFLAMFVFLSLPTFLMGITLPLLTKIYNRIVFDFMKSISLLYFVNTLGASIGALVGSYVVVSFFGLDVAVYLAVAINLVLAALIFVASRLPAAPAVIAERDPSPGAGGLGRLAYLLVLITGFLAIGYEIVWFRMVSVHVKASPYAFASILAVYLLGIALGSYAMNRTMARRPRLGARNTFFGLQFLAGFYVLVTVIAYYYLTEHTVLHKVTKASFVMALHPPYMIRTPVALPNLLVQLFSIVDIFFWPFVFLFVPTLVMGASFPLISLLALKDREREGRTVGVVYSFNIAGNVLGGLATGLILLPLWKTETTLLAFLLVNLAMVMFVTRLRGRAFSLVRRIFVFAALAAVAIGMFPRDGRLYEAMHVSPGEEYAMYLEEGRDGVVVAYGSGERVTLYINGMSHGGRPVTNFYLQALEAAGFSERLDKVLVVGFGTGSFVESALWLPEVKQVTLVELNESVIKNLTKMELFREMLNDPRVRIVIDDGRRYLQRADEKYDLVFLDPLRTTTAYSNNLYSKEFFELVREHLTPRGVLTVWMDEQRVLPKTLLSVFERVRKYKRFCIASRSPFEVNEAARGRLYGAITPDARAELEEHGSSFLGENDYIETVTAGYPINRDWRPVAEYYLGLRLKERFGAFTRTPEPPEADPLSFR